jgi:phosphohistidine phosphatase
LLAVFRHGPAAERSTATYPDDDARPLTAAGRKRVKASGRALRQAGFLPDRILFSPALRARETADILAKLFHAPEDSLRIEPALHGDADPAVLVRRTLRLRTPGRTLWIGHEPGLGEMIGLLTGGPALPLRKAGIALLEMRGTRGPAVLKALVPPEWTSALR